MPLKRTYALPSEIVEQFERSVAPRQRSAVVSALVREWLEQQQRERLKQDIIAGCEDMAEVYRELEAAYHPLEEEVQRGFEAQAR